MKKLLLYLFTLIFTSFLYCQHWALFSLHFQWAYHVTMCTVPKTTYSLLWTHVSVIASQQQVKGGKPVIVWNAPWCHLCGFFQLFDWKYKICTVELPIFLYRIQLPVRLQVLTFWFGHTSYEGGTKLIILINFVQNYDIFA